MLLRGRESLQKLWSSSRSSPARKEEESEVRYEERRKRELSQPYDAQAVEEARAMLLRTENVEEAEHGARSLARDTVEAGHLASRSKDPSSGASISTISSTPIRISPVATRT
jgi:hypothetical protein